MHNDNSKTTTTRTVTTTTTTTEQGHLILHVSQILALQHSTIYVDSFLLLLLLLFLLFFLLFTCHCAFTITDEEQENYTTTTATYRYIYRNCFIFLDQLSFYDDYSNVKVLLLLLLLKFMCSCTSTRTITGQQQHEMVTTTTTTHCDLHRLLSVQELIFPIQQQNMNTSSEKLMLVYTCHLIIWGYIWAFHLTSWHSWTLHLKTWPNSAVYDLLRHFIWKHDLILPSIMSSYLGVSDCLSGYFIWQVDLVMHFIWKLILPSVSNGLSLKT